MNILLYYFLAFFLFSVLGWVIETIFVRVFTKKWTNRGFLIGPYCPIYGVASLTMYFFLTPLTNYPILIFFFAAVLVSIIEFSISFILEKVFKARWWDYSQLPFNIDGRVCLIHAILFGILGVLFIYWIKPVTFAFIDNIELLTLNILSIIFLIIFTIDGILSLKIIKKVTETAEALKKDYTNEINEKVKEALMQQSYFTRRLINTFPNFKTIIETTHKQIKSTHKHIKKTIKKTHQNINEKLNGKK